MLAALRQIQPTELLRGLNSLLPFPLMRAQGTGGTSSAAYCYSVWLRHAVIAWQAGLRTMPQAVAELGPGDSLGIGLTALLFGTEQYYAFDVVRFAESANNLRIFDELAALAQARQDIPGPEVFPELKPYLDAYRFPHEIFPEEHLCRYLAPERLRRIRHSLEQPDSKDSLIRYAVPWSAHSVVQEKSVDLIFSQAVLEHVDDLADTYAAMSRWLKDEGWLSHQVDFKSHGTAKSWNGHWLYPDLLWKIIRGRRPYLLNREPYSVHKQLLAQAGFTVLREKTVAAPTILRPEQLPQRYQAEDSAVSGAHFLAVKTTRSR